MAARAKRRPPYRLLDHTADVALEASGRDLVALFEHAAQGMLSLLYDRRRVPTRGSLRFRVQGVDLPDLLVEWLRQIVAAHEVRGWRFHRIRVDRFRPEWAWKDLPPRGLASQCIFRLKNEWALEARGEGVRAPAPRLDREIKGVTYHGLEVRKTQGGWRARVIFDV